VARDAPTPTGMALPPLPFSPVVRSGDHVFTAGQVALGEDGAIVAGGIAEQTTQALANVQACLAAAGCSLDDVQKVNVYLADLTDFEEFNTVYRGVFTQPFPARTTVQVGLPPGLLIEIEAVARLPGR
jgi:2-iminobutanoate/2-iminopropanoate deaminase